MGSVASFDVIAPRERDGYEAINRAVAVFRTIDARLSMYSSTSEAAALERQAGGAPVLVSPCTEEILRFAQKTAEETGGRFDVTVEPLMRRWGFRADPGAAVERPTDAELRRLERLVDYHQLHLGDGCAALALHGMAIDVGGIAGGYALDRAVAAMRRLDVAAAFINFSGDIHCFGTPARGTPWTVDLVDPATQAPRAEPMALHDEALSTSGSYQNRRHNPRGRSWGHLIAPHLAIPVEPMGSITAVHPSAMVADAWSTAVYVGASAEVPGLRLIRL